MVTDEIGLKSFIGMKYRVSKGSLLGILHPLLPIGRLFNYTLYHPNLNSLLTDSKGCKILRRSPSVSFILCIRTILLFYDISYMSYFNISLSLKMSKLIDPFFEKFFRNKRG